MTSLANNLPFPKLELMAPGPKPNGAIINADADDDVVDLEPHRLPHASNTAADNCSAVNEPALFHKVKDKKSILAIIVSDSKIFAGTQGGELLVWSLDTYELLSTISAHRGALLALYLSPDGSLLFSSAGDAIVNVWCTQSLVRLYHIWSIYDVGDVFCVAYSPAQQTVYLGAQNTSIQWHKFSSGTQYTPPSLESHPLNRRNKFFDSIGPGAIATPRRVVVADILAPGGELVEIGKEHIVQYAHYGYVYCMLLVKGGICIDTRDETLLSGGGDGTIKLWQIANNGDEGIRHFATLGNGDKSILSMAVHGTFLYAGRLEGDVDVWDIETKQLIRTVRVSNADILTVTVGQDLILTGGSDGWAKRFDGRYKCQSQWKAHDQLILASALDTHNGKDILVTGGNDDSVAIWDISQWRRKASAMSKPSNEELLESLRKLVSFRTVSSNPEHAEDCRRGASWLRGLFKRFGGSTEMLNTDDKANPIVFARFKGRETSGGKGNKILFYAHYDVVAADNAQQKWNSDPFDMQGINGYLYGRGTSDNKGPMLAALYAVADLVAENKLASDVVFVVEGEEECGSREFKKTIRNNKHLIGDIDWILLANSYWLDDDVPCLTYGLRGVIHSTIKIESRHPDLHSGVEGSHMMDESLKDLVMLLATLSGPNGRVNIPNFYDTVLPITEPEKKRYDAISKSLLRRNPDVATAEEITASFKAKWREPSFTMHGFKTSGPANSTIIPHTASAAVSFRLVPDQDPKRVQQAFVTFLKHQFANLDSLNKLSITIDHQADPWLGDPDNKIFKMLERAIMDVWGPMGQVRRDSSTATRVPPEHIMNGLSSPKISPVTSSTLTQGSIVIPQSPLSAGLNDDHTFPDTKSFGRRQKPLYIREGGSIPAIRFLEKEFNAQAAHLPCGQASDNAHLDNERLRLLNLYKTREIFKRVFGESWS